MKQLTIQKKRQLILRFFLLNKIRDPWFNEQVRYILTESTDDFITERWECIESDPFFNKWVSDEEPEEGE